MLLTIINHRRPYIDPSQRVIVEQIVPRLTRVTAHYGFMEAPDVAEILAGCRTKIPPEIDLDDADYFFARPRIVPAPPGPRTFPKWRRWLLTSMMRNANPLTDSLGIPPDRIIEFGVALPV